MKIKRRKSMTGDKIIRFEARSQVATKEFELQFIKGKFYLSVCAYGDLWQEEFSSLKDLKEYLQKEWRFEKFPFLEGVIFTSKV
jgi:hypothetical protein